MGPANRAQAQTFARLILPLAALLHALIERPSPLPPQLSVALPRHLQAWFRSVTEVSSSPGTRGRALASAVAFTVAFAGAFTGTAVGPGCAQALASSQVDDQRGTQLFTLSEDREARSLFESSRGHLAAGRWERAAIALQSLIEDHRADVLPALAGLEDAPFSSYDHYLGASEWAQRQLRLNAESLSTPYRERFGDIAEQRYGEASTRGDRVALAEVAWRWPLTAAAERARWSLGDLAFADGRFNAAESWWLEASGPDGAMPPARARALDDARRRDPRPGDRSFELPHPGSTPKRPGGDGQEQWELILPPGPFGGNLTGTSRESWNLWPMIVGDRIYVSTSLQVLSVDAYGGERQWISDQPEGWDKLRHDERMSFWRPVDGDSSLIAPAVGSGVVVAPLHVPLSRDEDSSIANTSITVKLPERRLFAYDTASGKPLWNHAPPLDWDGYEPVPFQQEMHVAGPPVVSEGRLFVPCTLMQGRIKLHIACYDLFDGALLWQTPVISGQQELNMFNRHLSEFSAAPVHLDGDRLFVATQLGCVAALDAASGRLVWEARYEQLPLPQNRGLVPGQREQYWRNAPPVVSDNAVIVTPTDSNELLGFDRQSGSVLWARPVRRLNNGSGYLDSLLGVSEDTIFLGGDHLASLRRSGGLGSTAGSLTQTEPNLSLTGEDDLGSYRAAYDPRALLCEDAVLVPMDNGLLTVDRVTGVPRSIEQPAWRRTEGQGNLAVADGLLVSLRGNRLTGFLDLGALELRARELLAAEPDFAEARIELARLLDRRALRAREDGEVSLALRRFEEATELLSGLDTAERSRVADAEVALRRHWAQLLEDEGRTDQAREQLDLARALASDDAVLLAVLLDLERSLRYAQPAPWLELLGDLESTCGHLMMEQEYLESEASWGEWLSPERRLFPTPVPVRLWVHVRRGLGLERHGDIAGAVSAWHAVLYDYAEFPVADGLPAGDRAEARLRAWIDEHGEDWLSPFEEQASQELAGLAEGGSDDQWRRLVRRYPLTVTARRAQERRLASAAEVGDAESAGEAARWLLSSERAPDPEGLGRDDVRLLLARTLGAAGNTELQLALARELDGGAPPALKPAPLPTFNAGVGLEATLPGEYLIVGRLPEAGPLLVWRSDQLEIFGDANSAEPTWSTTLRLDSNPLNRPHRWLLGTERIGVVNYDSLVAFDARTGAEAWRWPERSAQLSDRVRVRDVSRADGVVLALAEYSGGRAVVCAFDEIQGVLLWEHELGELAHWRPPLATSGRAVLIRQESGRPCRVELLDLFDGSSVGVTELPAYLDKGAVARALVARDTLILSSFTEHQLLALDLRDGRSRWRYEPRPGHELYALLQSGERCFAVEVPQTLGQGGGGELLEFEPRLGSRRVIHRMSPHERLVGVPNRDLVSLDAQRVLTVTNSPSTNRTRVGCIDLDNGLRWLREVPVGHDELYDLQWTPPVFGADEVLFVYSQRSGASARRRKYYAVFFDTDTGTPRDTRVIPEGGASLQRIEAVGFGSSLWIGCLSSQASKDRVLVWTPNDR